MNRTGKVAVVTGASRGIGKQVAVELGRRGVAVVVAARTVEPRKRLPGTLGATVAAVKAVGGTALAVAADMAVEEDLLRLAETAVQAFGRIDILVNNAAATGGRAWGASLADLSRADWLQQYAVNLHAPFSLTKAISPVMRSKGGGVVINLTTAAQLEFENRAGGLPTPLAYPSSKAALDQFCRSAAPELRAQNIAIINVNPGFVRTEMVDLLAAAGVDATGAIDIGIPARAISHLATCADPMRYTGQILQAAAFVEEMGL